MRLRNSFFLALLVGPLLPAASFSYHVLGDDPMNLLPNPGHFRRKGVEKGIVVGSEEVSCARHGLLDV